MFSNFILSKVSSSQPISIWPILEGTNGRTPWTHLEGTDLHGEGRTCSCYKPPQARCKYSMCISALVNACACINSGVHEMYSVQDLGCLEQDLLGEICKMRLSSCSRQWHRQFRWARCSLDFCESGRPWMSILTSPTTKDRGKNISRLGERGKGLLGTIGLSP